MTDKTISPWTRGNVIAYMERAALAASLVAADQFDDRDLYDVDGGLQSKGPINAVIEPPWHLDDGQQALFYRLLNLIYERAVGPRPSSEEPSNVIADTPLVGMCQQVIRGVIALPHDRREAQAHQAVRKLENEDRTRRADGEEPQSSDALTEFAEQAAKAINLRVEQRLDLLRGGKHLPD